MRAAGCLRCIPMSPSQEREKGEVEEWGREVDTQRRQGEALRELLAVLRGCEERASKLTAVRDSAAAADADAVRIAKENGEGRVAQAVHHTQTSHSIRVSVHHTAAAAITSLLGRMHPAAALAAEFATSQSRAKAVAAEDASAADTARDKLARITRKLDQGR